MVYTEQGKEEEEAKDKGGGIGSRGLSTKKILEMKEGVWKGGIREDAGAKALGSCSRTQEKFRTQEREGVLTF